MLAAAMCGRPAAAVEFEEHNDQYCAGAPSDDDCGAMRRDPFPNKCWAYWSDTDALEDCKAECIKRRCGWPRPPRGQGNSAP